MTAIDQAPQRGAEYALMNTSVGPMADAGKSTRMWVEYGEPDAERVVLYLHAGAVRCCGSRSHKSLLNRISGTLQALVLMVDYRTWPEHTIHQGIDDAVTAYRYLLTAGFPADQIVLAVDSADNDLTIMVPLAIRELKLPAPASVVAISPLREKPNFDDTTEHTRRSSCALLPSIPVAVS
ncbi:alpha/beta hydrolase [Nocardia rhamnosiphila]